jgi:hypothetical protein
MNKQKFVHYVMVTFTYGVGATTVGMIVYAFSIIITNIKWRN